MASNTPLVTLFGYDSSTFTLKVRLALRLKQIPYTFVAVPTMMPRPLLRENFHLTYRKIPVLAIGKEIYCDSSIILEALEHFFPESEGYQSLYPKVGQLTLLQSLHTDVLRPGSGWKGLPANDQRFRKLLDGPSTLSRLLRSHASQHLALSVRT